MKPAPPRVIDRIHAFDALRGGMMMLGVVIHTALSYTVYPVLTWPFHDRATSPVFDWLCLFIHNFRLPLFFVMAGFFAALLTSREGVKGMLYNRWQRLIIPLVISWVMLAPLTLLGGIIAGDKQAGAAFKKEFWSNILHNPFQMGDLLFHLWFIYDLFLFCLVAAVCVFFGNRFPLRIRALIGAGLRKLLRYPGAPVALALATALTLYPMQRGFIDHSASLLPPIRILVTYSVFFGFGWLLFGERAHLVEVFQRSVKRRILSGCFAFVLHVIGSGMLQIYPSLRGSAMHWMTVLTGAMACWWFIFGFTGVGLRYFSASRPWVRYLTDASYTVFIVHLPFVLFTVPYVALLHAPAILKFLIVFSVAMVLSLLLYHYAVRNTVIGKQLSGRRYSRVWPPICGHRWKASPAGSTAVRG